MADHGISLRDFFDEKFRALDEKIRALDEKADRTIALQEATNGRVRSAEKAIAVLSWAYGLGAAVIAWLVIR